MFFFGFVGGESYCLVKLMCEKYFEFIIIYVVKGMFLKNCIVVKMFIKFCVFKGLVYDYEVNNFVKIFV